jgi:hypothetical protein
LRAIAEARIPWSFRPPALDPSSAPPSNGDGIWLGPEHSPYHLAVEVQTDEPRHGFTSEEEEEGSGSSSDGESEEEEEEESEEESDYVEDEEPLGLVTKKRKPVVAANVGSMFGALEIEGGEDNSEESEAEEEEESETA